MAHDDRREPLHESPTRRRRWLLALFVLGGALAFAAFSRSPVCGFLAATTTIVWVMVIGAAVHNSMHDASLVGPLFGGAVGTIGGGAAFAVLWLLLQLGTNELEFSPSTVFFGALTLLFATVFGVFWAAGFLVLGVLAGWCLIRLRRTNDVWTGIVCGAVTGYTALTVPMVFVQFHLDDSLQFISIPSLCSAVVGAVFGGYGSSLRCPQPLRWRRPAPITPAASESPVLATPDDLSDYDDYQIHL